jgi:multidrug efflux pump subunit AcrB
MQSGADPQARLAVASATQEVVGAIVGSSLTTIVVFLPLIFLEGVVGQFFRSLSLSLGISIVASMVVSLVYSPLMMLIPWLRPRAATRKRRVMTWIQDRYARMLAGLLEQPLVLGATLVLALLLGLVSLRGMRTGFLPEMDEGGFVLDYFLPVGTSLQETEATCRRIEQVLQSTPEVGSFSRRTGAELGFFATEQFTGDILVGLVPQRERSIFAVIHDVRQRLAREVPQAQVEFIQVMQDTIADLSGNPAPIEVKLLGTDYPALQQAADAVAKKIAKIDGVVDVVSGVSFGSPELRWRPDPASAARFGLSAQSIASELTTQLLGDVATSVLEHDRLVDVRVRSGRRTNQGLLDETEGPAFFLHPPDLKGSPSVPLGEVARFERQLNENELERENQTAMVRVTAQVAGRDLGSASRAVEAAVMSLPHDPALRVELGGQSESQKTAFTNLLEVLAVGIGLVFFLLVVQFRSLVLPVVMFLALPFGQVGGLGALRLTGVALNISSGMGLIMLVGLVVKNGIIMIEYAQQLHRGGETERAAIIAAARVRLRPILMTSLAAIAGLLPLALGIGVGTELQRPLAIVVVGGLLVSTVCTLLVVPLGCATLARGRLTPEAADAR